uniref:NADH dehydrogenase subunit 4 n=1 Tax=Cosmolaelaps hrdyi TaxID=3126097 RepID=UPI0030E395A8
MKMFLLIMMMIILSLKLNFVLNMFFFMSLFFLILNYLNSMNFYLNGIYLDGISVFLNYLSIWLVNLMFLLSMKSKEKNLLIMLMMMILILSFSVINLLMFYIFFEMILFPMMILIKKFGFQKERFMAMMYMFMYTMFGSLPLLVVLILMNKMENLSFFYLSYLNMNLSSLSVVFLFLAFLVKFPLYGFHLWLPKAHVQAPVEGSMILAGVLLKLGGYGCYRMMMIFNFNLKNFQWLIEFILLLSLMGAIVVGILCLLQIDVKILIAYSSVCHMGMVIASIMTMTSWGVEGFFFLMLSHGLGSSMLFCIANFFYERYYSRNMIILKGMSLIFPSMMLFWFFSCGVNLSMPPFMNLVGEVFIFGSLMKYSYYMIIFIVMISFLSGFYSLFLFSFIFHGKFMFLMGVNNMTVKEYKLMFFHLIPLFLYLFKMEMFMI